MVFSENAADRFRSDSTFTRTLVRALWKVKRILRRDWKWHEAHRTVLLRLASPSCGGLREPSWRARSSCRELPAMFCALRFAVAALPCLFVSRPKISLRLFRVAWPGDALLVQFMAQSYGLAHSVPPGLMGVIVQTQALFTVVLAALEQREMPTRAQVRSVSAWQMVGLVMICGTVGGDFSLQAFLTSMISPIGLFHRKAVAAARLATCRCWTSPLGSV